MRSPVLLLLAAGLSACASTADLDYLRADPDFTAARLAEGGLAVMPVRATTPMLHQGELAVARARLVQQLEAKYSVHVVDGSLVEAILADDRTLAGSLESYATALAIDHADLRAIGQTTGARYVAVTVLDEYSFGWHERPEPRYEPAGASSFAAGVIAVGLVVVLAAAGLDFLPETWPSPQPEPTEKEVTATAYAQLAGTLSVFDARELRVVWVGANVIRQEASESIRVPIETTVNPNSPGAPIPKPTRATRLFPRFYAELVAEWP